MELDQIRRLSKQGFSLNSIVFTWGNEIVELLVQETLSNRLKIMEVILDVPLHTVDNGALLGRAEMFVSFVLRR